ncbi:tripartite tricarboxylate transporter substrate binding protein [Variovorax sp. LG9.2]|uniref:Bug family tripartite tricarboxylate transporter substrate binding protein n=1 Tax=Variovorax sp. LG9.2 TaxID=3048626 RepID=UPI002B23652A|nr:tripartite tricarboxylate transporter substrate binding protein [Variovorax sp. LG9.2]MEB0056214.1 tripartite tricarboxylate transporter substrate binding protein [Variovorax sp. LG9.2]
MKREKMMVLTLAFSLALTIGWSVAAEEPPWPTKPVRVIVPGGAGGVIDIRTRWLAVRLAPLLGQSVIVENKPGAGGNLGMELGAHSSPDGYTLTIIHMGVMTANPHLYSRLGYDPLIDFTPITYLGVGPLLLAVHPDVPATTVAELVRLAKESPGKLNFGSPGIGTPPHLAGELFKRVAAIETVHVPYKGGGQAVSDLIAGHISYSIEGLTVQLPQVQAGHLRALAVTGPHRAASLPDVPTMAEAGLAGAEFQGWVGIAVPAATPKTIVARLYRDIGSILATPEAHAWFGETGAEARADPPDVFLAAIRAEHAKWGKVIREAGIKIE